MMVSGTVRGGVCLADAESADDIDGNAVTELSFCTANARGRRPGMPFARTVPPQPESRCCQAVGDFLPVERIRVVDCLEHRERNIICERRVQFDILFEACLVTLAKL